MTFTVITDYESVSNALATVQYSVDENGLIQTAGLIDNTIGNVDATLSLSVTAANQCEINHHGQGTCGWGREMVLISREITKGVDANVVVPEPTYACS